MLGIASTTCRLSVPDLFLVSALFVCEMTRKRRHSNPDGLGDAVASLAGHEERSQEVPLSAADVDVTMASCVPQETPRSGKLKYVHL